MIDRAMPSMEPLAPLVDQLVAIAEEEIPAARTCYVRLFDDMTYRIIVEHRYGDHKEAIVYDRNTGEVYWRDTAGVRTMRIPLISKGETVVQPYFVDDAERVVTTIEPPIECEELETECIARKSPLLTLSEEHDTRN